MNTGPRVVGLLAPMPSEMQPLARALALVPDADKRVYRGRIGTTELIGARTGIGTTLAREAATRMLDQPQPPQHVMVVGVAGGMGPSQVGDVLFPETVVDKDSGTEYRSTPIGGVTPAGKLVTHDDFDMGPDELQRLVAGGFVAVDMETAAIAAVCHERGVPWIAVRAISDLVGVTPGDVIGLANPDGTPNVGASIKYLVTKPWRIPKLLRLARESTGAARAAAEAAQRLLAAS
jgi:adenosylhomocysteine nucleosidase